MNVAFTWWIGGCACRTAGRVSDVSPQVDGELVSSIGPGLLCLVGLKDGDSAKDVEYMSVFPYLELFAPIHVMQN
jgi:D-Tyr-tRNA(Tyr) deacylase